MFAFLCSVSNDSGLTVKETRITDAGVYACHALSPLGKITKNFTLLVVGKIFSLKVLKVSLLLKKNRKLSVVIAPPKLTAFVEPKKTIIEGHNVSLPCQVYALPPPSITWILNGNTLSVDGEKYLMDNNSLR